MPAGREVKGLAAQFIFTALSRATEARKARDFAQAWKALVDAHIVSQPHTLLHCKVHWHMLMLAVHEKNGTELVGQLIRLLVAAPGSILGKYPAGNSGRSNVSMFLPMPVPDELSSIIAMIGAADRTRREQ